MSHPFSPRAIAAAVLLTAVMAPAAQAGPRRPVAASGPQQVQGAQDQGATPAQAPQNLRVYLQPQGGLDALKAAVDSVSTPGSAGYAQYLTPDQYRAKFAPSADTVKSLKQWLKGQGFSIANVEPSNRYVAVTGTADQADAAFATSLREYSRAGVTFQAPASTPTLPDSVAVDVLAVSGLNTEPKPRKAGAQFPPPDAFVNGRPCSNFYGQVRAKFQADFKTPLPKFNNAFLPYAPCGYQGQQLRSAYEGSPAYDGSGVKVGIVDAYAAPTIAQDANTYAKRHGYQGFGGSFSQRNAAKFKHANECDPSGWFGEETLDVEAVHAMAPGASVRYYGAASCENDDIADTLDNVVDDDFVSIVSNSYGDLESNETPEDVAANEQAFLQGAMEGMSFFFSSGDDGDEVASSGILQADYPASDPYVTTVGGTSTGIDADGALSFATGWGTNKYTLSDDGKSWTPVGFLYGAGGGFSSLFNRPAYQNKVVPASAPAGRAEPDVAMDADPTTGMLVGETQQFPDGPAYGEYRIGGTSLASPLMAGLQAVAQQRAGGPQGFLNPSLYQAARKQPGLFLDIAGAGPDAGNVRSDYANGIDPSDGVLYSVRTFNQDSSLAVGPGWDDVTGIGSPSQKYIAKFNASSR